MEIVQCFWPYHCRRYTGGVGSSKLRPQELELQLNVSRPVGRFSGCSPELRGDRSASAHVGAQHQTSTGQYKYPT